MSLFGQTKRHTPTSKPRTRSPLPIFTNDLEKKFDLGPGSPISGLSRYLTVVYIPIPRIPSGRARSSESLMNGHGSTKPYHSYGHKGRRYVRICLPIPPRLYARIPRLNSPMRLLLAVLLLVGILLFVLGIRRKPGGGSTWSPPFTDPDSLVITMEEAAMIWEWEVLSGHHPSLHPDESIGSLDFHARLS